MGRLEASSRSTFLAMRLRGGNGRMIRQGQIARLSLRGVHGKAIRKNERKREMEEST